MTDNVFSRYNPSVASNYEHELGFLLLMMEGTKEGRVLEALPNLSFKVKMNDSGTTILAHLAGKMKMHNIRVLAGDRVLLEMSPDGTIGRIVRRL